MTTEQVVDAQEITVTASRWKMLTGTRLLELGMLASSIGLAGGVILLLILGKLEIIPATGLLKYATVLINIGATTFMICAAGRVAVWSKKK